MYGLGFWGFRHLGFGVLGAYTELRMIYGTCQDIGPKMSYQTQAKLENELVIGSIWWFRGM